MRTLRAASDAPHSTPSLVLCQQVLWVRAGLSVLTRRRDAVAALRDQDVVALDHAIEGFAIDVEDAGCGLLISTSVFQHAGNVAAFDFRKSDPIIRWITRRRRLRIKGLVADAGR